MSKSVVINLGHGDLNNGFPRVTAQLWAAGNPLPEQFIGSLPAQPELIELYRNWQSIYQNLCDRFHLLSRSNQEDDELEIDQGAITNVSVVSFDQVCQKLQQSINTWLKSQEFLHIEQQLRSALDPAAEIRVIIETNDEKLQRLPWHRWHFFEDYPKAEMALSRQEYKRARSSQQPKPQKKVRILAILGNSQGIDLKTEASLLKSLPDAEVVFLVNPTRQELNTQLRQDPGWDILFFAGHSQTKGETGLIYINQNKTNNSLTIEQLESGLKQAIEKGLKLAIFNSCDGLGLGNALEKLNIPQVIVMREPVPNRVAQEFFKHFLDAFAAKRLPLYVAVQQARKKLQALEDDFPGASWLPVIYQNPAVEPLTWLHLGGIPPCPYRGLFAFREEDALLFFGRSQFTQDLVTALKTKPLVAVVGSSGSGKSSVVFASLIPHLRVGMQGFPPANIVSFRPGNNPFAALAHAIAPLVLGAGGAGEQKENSSVCAFAPDTLRGRVEERTQVSSSLRDTNPKSKIENRFTPLPDYPSTSLEKLPSTAQSLRLNATWSFDETACRLVEQELAIAFQQDNAALDKIIFMLVQQKTGTRLVLIADQFEEIYTLCPESEKKPFLDLLLTALKLAPAFNLVLTMRADFYGYALSYRPLSDALQGAVYNLGSMNREELRSAIEQPAAQMQVRLEKGLTNIIIDAVEGQPGRLPLLEFALTTLWAKQTNGLLTHQAYFEIGGVESALANHAEAVYAQLSEPDRLRARVVFMQLVHLGESQPTRRLATRDEVKAENWDLVTRLASSRLVVTNRNTSTGEETVEIVHETLIRSWGRLDQWMQVDGKFRRWQEQLRAARHQWESSGKDEGALLRGKPLADAEFWLCQRLDELSSRDRYFIELSLALQDSETGKQKRQRQRIIVGLSGGLVGALMLAGVAWWQWQNSAKSEIEAISASSEALFASNKKLDALIEAIKARRKLQQLGRVDADIQTQVESVLRRAVYGAVEYDRLSGHRDEVKAVVFSPDGKIIASTSADKTIKLWQPDGTNSTTLKGHNDLVWQVVFSPDGKTIASASADNTVKLWKLDLRKMPILLTTLKGHSAGVRGVALCPDGKMIASASDDTTVKLWQRDGTLLATLKGHSGVVNSVTFSPDGKIIASASDDTTVKLWRRDGTNLATLKGHSGIVNSVAFSPDGKTLASTSWDNTIKLWKVDSKKPILLTTLKGHSDVVYGITFSPDGKTLASTSWDKSVKIWQPDGTLLTTLKGHSDRVWGISFSPDGRTLASASGDKTIKLWKLHNSLLTTLSGHSAVVLGVAFNPDGKMIASTSDDKTIKLWRRDGTLLTTLKGHTAQVYAVAFSHDGKTIVSASADNTVKVWQQDGKDRIYRLSTILKGHQSAIWGVAISPDGKAIASASFDNTVKLWQPDGTLIATLNGHQAAVRGVAFSPDGILASASVDNTVKLWKLEGKPILLTTLKGHSAMVNSVAFSPNGKTLASASADNTVKLWQLDGKLLTTLKGHSAAVYQVAFSPDGKKIASTSWDSTVKLWQPDGKLLTTLNKHNDRLWGVAFSPDGKTIASASEDKTVILWNLDRLLDLDKLMVYGCNWAHDYLKTNPDVHLADRHICDGVGNQ